MGYANGYANIKTGNVNYKYHNHTDSCKKTCNAYYTRDIVLTLGNGQYTANVYEHHPNCGQETKAYYWTLGDINNFNNQPCSHTYYVCGYTEGQIIGAEIIFN